MGPKKQGKLTDQRLSPASKTGARTIIQDGPTYCATVGRRINLNCALTPRCSTHNEIEN